MGKESTNLGTPEMIRLEAKLAKKVKAVAEAAGVKKSAVMRAAIRLGISQLETTPGLVKAIEAGMLEDESWIQLQAALKSHSERTQRVADSLEEAGSATNVEERLKRLESALENLKTYPDGSRRKQESKA